jgi:hypothetical protein
LQQRYGGINWSLWRRGGCGSRRIFTWPHIAIIFSTGIIASHNAITIICLMPGRIRIPDRIIIDKRIPVPRLRALTPGRHNRVGLREAAQRGVEPARVEEVNAETGLLALTGELVVRAEIAERVTRLAKGFVERGGGLGAVRVRGDGGTADVVAEQIREGSVGADGDLSITLKSGTGEARTYQLQ